MSEKKIIKINLEKRNKILKDILDSPDKMKSILKKHKTKKSNFLGGSNKSLDYLKNINIKINQEKKNTKKKRCINK